jgi:hypothetical protein
MALGGGTLKRGFEFGQRTMLKRLVVGANGKDLIYHLVRYHLSGMITSFKPSTEWRGTP